MTLIHILPGFLVSVTVSWPSPQHERSNGHGARGNTGCQEVQILKLLEQKEVLVSERAVIQSKIEQLEKEQERCERQMVTEYPEETVMEPLVALSPNSAKPRTGQVRVSYAVCTLYKSVNSCQIARWVNRRRHVCSPILLREEVVHAI